MAIFDINGLLKGRRIRRCSGAARWAYLYYHLLANGYSRIELDFEAIAEHFVSFRGTTPSAADVESHFKDYEDNHLGFVYEANGRRWMQFDTPNTGGKEWKTAVDLKSPEPPEEAYSGWLKEQHGDQWKKFHWYNPAHKARGSKQVPKWALPQVVGRDLTKCSPSLDQGSGSVVGIGTGIGTVQKKEPPLPPLNSESPENLKTKGGPAAPASHDFDSTMAGQALGEKMGLGGHQNRIAAKEACEAVKRRKPELRYIEIPDFIQGLWREYDSQATHAKVSLKTFLGEIGRFIDSDSWRVQSRAGPAAVKDDHGGHYEGTTYVTADGKRMPNYKPPPKPKEKQEIRS